MSVYSYIILETQKGQIVWDLMLHLFQPNTKITQGILKNTRYSGGYYVCIKCFSPRENCLSTRSAVKRPTDWANPAAVNTCKSTWGLRLRLLSLLTSLGSKAFKRVSPRIQSSKISYAITCSHIEGWALKITGVTCTYFLIVFYLHTVNSSFKVVYTALEILGTFLFLLREQTQMKLTGTN